MKKEPKALAQIEGERLRVLWRAHPHINLERLECVYEPEGKTFIFYEPADTMRDAD